MPQFDVSSFTSQLFWLATVFAFLYFLVAKFIAPRAEAILTARNRCLEENINHAEEYNRKAKTLDQMREEKLAGVNSLVENMQKQAVDTLDMHFNKQREELSSILNKKREKALADIDVYVKKFHEDEVEPCIHLVAFIIDKVTNKKTDMKVLKKIHGGTE